MRLDVNLDFARLIAVIDCGPIRSNDVQTRKPADSSTAGEHLVGLSLGIYRTAEVASANG